MGDSWGEETGPFRSNEELSHETVEKKDLKNTEALVVGLGEMARREAVRNRVFPNTATSIDSMVSEMVHGKLAMSVGTSAPVSQ